MIGVASGMMSGGGSGMTGGTDTGSAQSGGTVMTGGVHIGSNKGSPMMWVALAVVAVLLLRKL